MQDTRQKGSPRRSVWPALLLLLALAVFATACHGFGGFRHHGGVHSGIDPEVFCWDTTDSAVFNDADAYGLLESALFPGAPHDVEAWPGLESSVLNALFFFPSTCPFTGSGWAQDPSEQHIRYHFTSNDGLPAYCWEDTDEDGVLGSAGDTPYNCVGHFWAQCNSANCGANTVDCGDEPEGVHCGYRHQVVNLKDTTMSSSNPAIVIHTVNHETGHVLGLRDPFTQARTIGPEDWTGCETEVFPGIVFRVDSIMHAPPSYCFAFYSAGVFVEWPRPLDRAAVMAIMNNATVPTE